MKKINENIYEYKKDKILHVIVKVLLEPPIKADINQLMYVGGGYGDGEKNSLHITIQNEDVNINVNSMLIQEIITNRGINHDVKELTPLFIAVENEKINIYF